MNLFEFALTLVLIHLFLIINEGESKSNLKQLHVLFRHGERSPTETYPNDLHINYPWMGGWGQLTNRGKLQLYTLGKTIRSEYHEFIPSSYLAKDVNVTSSYKERCLMSAQVFCAGLYPPTDLQVWNEDLLWQPIPVHYFPRLQDRHIATEAPCAKYDKIFSEIRFTPKLAEEENSYGDLKNYLSKHTGANMSNIQDVEFLLITLEIEKSYNLTLPNWINDTLWNTMREVATRNLAVYTETEYMKRIKGGVFLQHVIESMENSLNGTDETKLYVYSGHDTTISHVIRTLGWKEGVKPIFGATLIFELYANEEVKVNYRNAWDAAAEDFNSSQCQKPCLLTKFKASLENVLPTDFVKECKLDGDH